LQSIYLRQPSNTMALYTLGYCYERTGSESEAIEFYQDCLKFKSHLQLPRQRIAAIYFKNGRVDQAICEYEMLTTEHPEDISSMVLLGYLQVADGQHDKAVDTFNMAIVAHPDNFNDDNQQEEAELIEAGEYEQAFERVQWLMEQVGEQPDLYVRMADILSRAGKTADAIVHYEKALQIQPNYLEATIKLGTHYLRAQRSSLAAEQFNRAIEINDEIVDAYIGLAISQQLSDEPVEAKSTLSLASAIQQNSTLLFSETATLHLQAAMQEETCDVGDERPILIEDVVKAHQVHMSNTPANADVHYKYGILMMVTGNCSDAIQSFETALGINPTHHRSRSKLAICLYDSGKVDVAMTALDAGSAIDSNSLSLHYKTAILYCDREQFASALYKVESAMKENYTEPDALVNIEVVLENLGLVDRAVATWERLSETARKAISARYQ
jgi:tetratricopeptide (TPR) repeat protein